MIKESLGRLNLSVRRINRGNWRLAQQSGGPGDTNLAARIISFSQQVDFYYSDIRVPTPLQIAGAWRADLQARRRTQAKIYGSSAQAVADFHEQMFFNELVAGLWNYGYWGDNIDIACIGNFAEDYRNYAGIFPERAYLVSTIPLPIWGMREDPGPIVRFTDLWHATQAEHVEQVAEHICARDGAQTINFLEIGSGFGGLAEKLARCSAIGRMVLTDIPHNLVTAFYYLSRCFGEDHVGLAATREEAIKLWDAGKKVVLIPTCHFDVIRELDGRFVLGNFGSFSEMDLATIQHYLQGLPAGVDAIVQINSNSAATNTGGHTEVRCDQFPVPSNFKILFGGQVTGSAASGGRYKASVHMRF
jgi:hypothetical protein